ncbi:MAG: polymerase sigma factor SigM [Actinomycetota bacterium]|jgi:RNA polymerase sigma-70 factor (ECF subfamily)
MTTDVREDAELLAAHVAGDDTAFAELVNRHRDRLWAVALRTTGDPEEAADALQDALISAFRRADSFRGESAVTTWLHRIVVNASLDRLRRRSIRSAAPLPEDDFGVTAPVVGNNHDQINQAELRWEITRALAELPEAQREAVFLVDVEGYSVEEAAALLDCPTGTVKSRCSRGRAKLAESLDFLRNPNTDSIVTRPEGGGQ